jgi:hypothetical protein
MRNNGWHNMLDEARMTANSNLSNTTKIKSL